MAQSESTSQLMPERLDGHAAGATKNQAAAVNLYAAVGSMEFQRRAFLILSLPQKVSIGSPETQTKERARFDLYGETFVVVEDNVGMRSDWDRDTSELVEQLTERELQIATLVASGEPTKRIAFQLGISEWTVSTHLRRIFAKLRVDTRAAMVYRCAPLIQRLDPKSRAAGRRHLGGRRPSGGGVEELLYSGTSA